MFSNLKVYALAALGAVVGLLSLMLGREKAKRKKAEREAEMREAVMDLHDKTAEALNRVEKMHREEIIDVEESLKTDRRDQLDNNF